MKTPGSCNVSAATNFHVLANSVRIYGLLNWWLNEAEYYQRPAAAKQSVSTLLSALLNKPIAGGVWSFLIVCNGNPLNDGLRQLCICGNNKFILWNVGLIYSSTRLHVVCFTCIVNRWVHNHACQSTAFFNDFVLMPLVFKPFLHTDNVQCGIWLL